MPKATANADWLCYATLRSLQEIPKGDRNASNVPFSADRPDLYLGMLDEIETDAPAVLGRRVEPLHVGITHTRNQ